MGRRSNSIGISDYKGKVTLVDRCPVNTPSCSLPPWIIAKKAGKRGDTNQYIACKKLNVGTRGTSLSGKGCAHINCVCESERDCNCGSTDYYDITLAGFAKAKKIKDDALKGTDDRLIHRANSAKLAKKGL